MDKVYAVIVDGDKLKAYDTQGGSLRGTFTYTGTVINGPVVTGDRCTVVFETPTGKIGRIFSLPGFNQVSTFSFAS